MKPDDVIATLKLVFELWSRSNWPQPLQDKFAFDLKKLPLEFAQAKAALIEMRSAKHFQSVQPCDVLDRLKSIVPKAAATVSSGGDTPLVKRGRQIARQGSREEPHESDRISRMSVGDLAQVVFIVLIKIRGAALQHAKAEVRAMLEEYWNRCCATDPAFAAFVEDLFNTTIEHSEHLEHLRGVRATSNANHHDELTPRLDRSKPKPGL